MTTLSDFSVGDRVELNLATSMCMGGAHYGEVIKVGRVWVHVRLDVNRRIIGMHPVNLNKLES